MNSGAMEALGIAKPPRCAELGIPLDALDKVIIHARHLLVFAQVLGGKPGSAGAVLGVVRYLLQQQWKQLPSSR
jgi:hypothetical protein